MWMNGTRPIIIMPSEHSTDIYILPQQWAQPCSFRLGPSPATRARSLTSEWTSQAHTHDNPSRQGPVQLYSNPCNEITLHASCSLPNTREGLLNVARGCREPPGLHESHLSGIIRVGHVTRVLIYMIVFLTSYRSPAHTRLSNWTL